MEFVSFEEQFKLYPIVDPETKCEIKIISHDFYRLRNKYGEPNMVKSLKKDKMIRIGKHAYRKLIIEGYNDKDIISPLKLHDCARLRFLGNHLFINFDIIQHIILYLNTKTIRSLSCINKKYASQSDYLWVLKCPEIHLFTNYFPKMSKAQLYQNIRPSYKLLLSCIAYNDIHCIQYLIRDGNYYGIQSNILIISASFGYLDVVKQMIKYIPSKLLTWDNCSGKKQDILNNNVINDALVESAKYGHGDVVSFLIQSGADVTYSCNLAFYMSIIHGHLDVVKLLVNNNRLLVYDNIGLFYAIKYNHQDICNFLLTYLK